MPLGKIRPANRQDQLSRERIRRETKLQFPVFRSVETRARTKSIYLHGDTSMKCNTVERGEGRGEEKRPPALKGLKEQRGSTYFYDRVQAAKSCKIDDVSRIIKQFLRAGVFQGRRGDVSIRLSGTQRLAHIAAFTRIYIAPYICMEETTICIVTLAN